MTTSKLQYEKLKSGHKCIYCYKPFNIKGTTCKECSIKKQQKYKEKYNKSKENKLCIKCGEKSEQITCKSCLKKIYNKKKNRRLASNICLSCVNPVENNKKYCNKCTNKAKENIRNIKKTNTAHILFLSIKRQKRNLNINITEEYIDKKLKKAYENNLKCPLCNKQMIIAAEKNNTKDSLSIDRINNNKGYIFGNISFICKDCNTKRGNATTDERRLIINYMTNYKQNNLIEIRNVNRYNIIKKYFDKNKAVLLKNRKFIISIDYFHKLFNSCNECPCCKAIMQLDNCLLGSYASLDAIDNNKDYSEDNVAIICRRCNIMKKNTTVEEQLKYIEYETIVS